MNFRMRSFLCAGLIGVSLPGGAVASESRTLPSSAAFLAPTAHAAAAVVHNFHAALKRGDNAVAASMLASDVLIFESGGIERSKAEYAAHHLSSDAAFAKATTHRIIHQSGAAVGGTAWIATEGRTTGTYKQQVIDIVSTETMILRRNNHLWQIVHIHWSSGKAKS